MKLKSLILCFLSIFVFISASHAQPAQPLLQYSWGNQIQSSQLILYIDGSIAHSEWANFKLTKVPEKKLTSAELEMIKALIDEVSIARVFRQPYEASFGGRSGTIDILVEGQMKPIDGILRTAKGAVELKNESPDLIKIKEFIRLYVSQFHL